MVLFLLDMPLTLAANAIKLDLTAGIFNHMPLFFSFFHTASDAEKVCS